MRLFKVEQCPVCHEPGAIFSWVETWEAWGKAVTTTEIEAQLWECPVSGCHDGARQSA